MAGKIVERARQGFLMSGLLTAGVILLGVLGAVHLSREVRRSYEGRALRVAYPVLGRARLRPAGIGTGFPSGPHGWAVRDRAAGRHRSGFDLQ